MQWIEISMSGSGLSRARHCARRVAVPENANSDLVEAGSVLLTRIAFPDGITLER